MNIKEAFISAINSIFSNKIRNFLSMFGIVVGISFVIVIVSLGDTAKIVVEELLAGESGGVSTVNTFVFKDNSFKQIDDFAIKGFLEKYSNIAYDVLIESPNETTGSVFDSSIDYDKNSAYSTITVKGVSKGHEYYNSVNVIKGRFINDSDCKGEKNTIVISSLTAEVVFGTTNCIGKQLTMISNDYKQDSYVVVGVYKYTDRSGTGNDKLAKKKVNTISYTTYSYQNISNHLAVNDNINKDYINIVPISEDKLQTATLAAQAYFSGIYSDDYIVAAAPLNSDVQSGMKMLPNVVTIAFLAIALITLTVGGIGVMNISLISVTEKTNEIGIYKALGAKNKQIAFQFLFESVIICVIAGLVGIAVGIGLDMLLESILPTVIESMPAKMGAAKALLQGINLQVNPSVLAVSLAFAITTITGVIFGTVPATRAAKMNVVDALRYE